MKGNSKNVTYKEARVYLDEVSKYGSVLGLEAIKDLLDELGNPQDALKFIHIAGTNGKGSVLAYTSTVLSEAGYRTGRYISPTVISYLERIQVDGKWIPEQVFAELVEEVKDAIARMEVHQKASPTVFEVETAIAFLYFKKMNCDLVVLEAGLGGREDATNIVSTTIVAVFTTISIDHIGILGNRLEEIADNKAGIIKPECVVVSSVQAKAAADRLTAEAQVQRCRIIFARPECAVVTEADYRHQIFQYKEYEPIEIRLAGTHQVENAVTALEVVGVLKEEGYSISDEAVHSGMRKTEWVGRFTCLCQAPFVIVDGAHNRDAAGRLKESLKRYFPKRRIIIIMGVFRDKEYQEIAKIMVPVANIIYTVDLPDKERTLSAEELRETCLAFCTGEQKEHVVSAGTVQSAVTQALAAADKQDIILAFGSLSYLGQVIQNVKEIRGNEND